MEILVVSSCFFCLSVSCRSRLLIQHYSDSGGGRAAALSCCWAVGETAPLCVQCCRPLHCCIARLAPYQGHRDNKQCLVVARYEYCRARLEIVFRCIEISAKFRFTWYRVARVFPSILWRPQCFFCWTERTLWCAKCRNRTEECFLFIGAVSSLLIH